MAVFTQLYPEPERQFFRWSLTTAYTALALLAVTLSLGVWNVMRGQRNPVSSDLRRDLGIWCALLSLAHVIVGLNVHMKKWTLYFVQETSWLRWDLFGAANYLGAVAGLVVIGLLATSNDFSIRLLGKHRWKNFQRLNYLYFFFVGLHGAIYLVVEKRLVPYTAILGLMGAWVVTVQLVGFRRQRLEEVRSTRS
jgi:sulfoxide reductase heme-binding subunit YedZ